MTATKLGISSPVSCRKTQSDSPRFTTSSTKRSDWVSQIRATSALVAATSAMANWRNM